VSRGRPQALLLHIWIANTVAGELLDANMRDDGMEAPFYGTLSLIGAFGPLTPSELAERSGARPTTISDRVRRLVASGDVERIPNPDDGRSYLLQLTLQGDALWRDGWPALRRTITQIAKELDRPVEEVDEMLQDLIAAAERASSKLNTKP
jgi:DNA-binding MarR family transcriptional regulator